MAFLNKSILQKKVEERLVGDHPLLKNGDIPSNIKQVYLEGCVLATLMDDEKVSPVERAEIGKRAFHASRVNVHGYNLDKKQNSKLGISAEELGFLELAG